MQCIRITPVTHHSNFQQSNRMIMNVIQNKILEKIYMLKITKRDIAEFMVPSAYIPELSITLQWRKSRNLGEIELVFIIVPKLHVSDSYESRAQYSDPKSTCLMKKWHQFTTKVQ
ncbi:unnamed protein product [Musa banksii]